MPELGRILECQCASQAAELFTSGLTRVLDVSALIKTIRNKNNYAPFLQETTKSMMEVRNEARRRAGRS